MTNICIFGDSIARGRNAPQEEGWAHHLKKFIEERDPETRVINRARDGETTKVLLTYLQKECEEYKPSEVILAIGVNDSIYSFTDHRQYILRDEFEKNIEEIIDMLQKYAKKIVIVGIGHVDEKSSVISDTDNKVYQYQNIVIQKFNDSLKGIASTKGAQYIDVYGLLADDDLDDGLHPNAAGHEKLFATIKSQAFA